ncbi:hypothetical protein J3Q64DRAFT_1838096 [Phycomyces blakesleeanus]|uniref:Uncharacterized protein n=1 Tax=Phycomyces blakesleeanus TaxID=4837 RepID=A0ABR3ARH2_PHYBL
MQYNIKGPLPSPFPTPFVTSVGWLVGWLAGWLAGWLNNANTPGYIDTRVDKTWPPTLRSTLCLCVPNISATQQLGRSPRH